MVFSTAIESLTQTFVPLVRYELGRQKGWLGVERGLRTLKEERSRGGN